MAVKCCWSKLSIDFDSESDWLVLGVAQSQRSMDPNARGHSGDLERSKKRRWWWWSCLKSRVIDNLTCSIFLNVVGVSVDVVRVGTPLIPLIPLLNPPSFTNWKERRITSSLELKSREGKFDELQIKTLTLMSLTWCIKSSLARKFAISQASIARFLFDLLNIICFVSFWSDWIFYKANWKDIHTFYIDTILDHTSQLHTSNKIKTNCISHGLSKKTNIWRSTTINSNGSRNGETIYSKSHQWISRIEAILRKVRFEISKNTCSARLSFQSCSLRKKSWNLERNLSSCGCEASIQVKLLISSLAILTFLAREKAQSIHWELACRRV